MISVWWRPWSGIPPISSADRKSSAPSITSPYPPISETVATAAYRIAQEALTNTVRHSQATKAIVTLQAVNHHLLLTVRDDGRGFDPQAVPESEGIGLAGMKERANLVGGRLRVRSVKGEGTQIRLEVPLEDPGRTLP